MEEYMQREIFKIILDTSISIDEQTNIIYNFLSKFDGVDKDNNFRLPIKINKTEVNREVFRMYERGQESSEEVYFMKKIIERICEYIREQNEIELVKKYID